MVKYITTIYVQNIFTFPIETLYLLNNNLSLHPLRPGNTIPSVSMNLTT